jgi:hypothetical protein
MPDRIEREINEILAKLDELPPDVSQPERRPISIAEARGRKRQQERRKNQARLPTRMPFSPPALLLSGAGAVIGFLVLASAWAPLIWGAFAGVLLFIAGFIASLVKRPVVSRSAAPPSGGVFWRDRYIQYDPKAGGSVWDRLRGRKR